MTTRATELMEQAQQSVATAQTVLNTVDHVPCPWCLANELTIHVSRGLLTVVCGLGDCRFSVAIRTKE